MPSRREFITRSIAVSAFAVCPSGVRQLMASGAARPHSVAMVLFDRSSAQAAAFGAEAARLGVPALAVGADVGGAWMHEIAPLWRQGRGAIAGMTRGVPLFCLELLARDYGMRVIHRAQHVDGGDVEAAGGQSGAAAARITLACAAAPPVARIPLLDLARDTSADRALFSWLIAPADVERALARNREPRA